MLVKNNTVSSELTARPDRTVPVVLVNTGNVVPF
jgi:hypothetical protein